MNSLTNFTNDKINGLSVIFPSTRNGTATLKAVDSPYFTVNTQTPLIYTISSSKINITNFFPNNSSTIINTKNQTTLDVESKPTQDQIFSYLKTLDNYKDLSFNQFYIKNEDIVVDASDPCLYTITIRVLSNSNVYNPTTSCTFRLYGLNNRIKLSNPSLVNRNTLNLDISGLDSTAANKLYYVTTSWYYCNSSYADGDGSLVAVPTLQGIPTTAADWIANGSLVGTYNQDTSVSIPATSAMNGKAIAFCLIQDDTVMSNVLTVGNQVYGALNVSSGVPTGYTRVTPDYRNGIGGAYVYSNAIIGGTSYISDIINCVYTYADIPNGYIGAGSLANASQDQTQSYWQCYKPATTSDTKVISYVMRNYNGGKLQVNMDKVAQGYFSGDANRSLSLKYTDISDVILAS